MEEEKKKMEKEKYMSEASSQMKEIEETNLQLIKSGLYMIN